MTKEGKPGHHRVAGFCMTRQSVASRLRAARLLSRLSEVGQIVSHCRIKDSTYRALESGRRPIKPPVAEKLAAELKVSAEYISSGTISIDKDRRACNLSGRLLRAGMEGYATARSDIHYRLVRLRRARGHQSASAAARSMGWSADRYGDHESRRRNIPLDQAIRYGLGFDGMAGVDYLLFDEDASTNPEQAGIE